jgi:hypothetical protein
VARLLFLTNSGEGVSNLGLLTPFHARVEVDVSDLACAENGLGSLKGIHDSDLANIVLDSRGKRDELLTCAYFAIENAH